MTPIRSVGGGAEAWLAHEAALHSSIYGAVFVCARARARVSD